MKRTLHNLSLLLCLAAAVLASSCVYEDEVPCPCGVRFVYDMNMEFADAFAAQVDDVTLLIFDAEGRYLDTRTAQGLLGRAGGSRIELGDLPPGTYRLLAWAGLCNEAAPYALLPAPLVPGETTLNQVMLRLEGVRQGEHGAPLADVWHGLLTDFTVTGHSPAEGTIRLTKDTNRFRILVQTAGQAMRAADYCLGISAANACLGWDNRPGATPDAEVVYRPYVQAEAAIEDEAGGTAVTALTAEMATLRLMADGQQRFTVENTARGETLMDIDLIRYLDLMRLDEHAAMPLQEFLDRENTWNIILLMGTDGTLLTIQINAWILVLNQTEL